MNPYNAAASGGLSGLPEVGEPTAAPVDDAAPIHYVEAVS
jgi:hypothetical protein